MCKRNDGKLIVLVAVLLMMACGVPYFYRKIVIDSTDATDHASLFLRDGDSSCTMYFAPRDTIHITPQGSEDFPSFNIVVSERSTKKYRFIFLGTRQSEIDSFPVRPFKIRKGKIDGAKCLIYYYGDGICILDVESRLYQYMKVYIRDGRVVRMRGKQFAE